MNRAERDNPPKAARRGAAEAASNRQTSATLPPTERKVRAGRAASRKKAAVLHVIIFKRPGSKFFQASVSIAGKRNRITTRTTLPQAAKEFAELAYRHFARADRADRQSGSDSVSITPPHTRSLS